MFNKLLQKFDALTGREKWMVVLTLLITLAGSWYQFFYVDIVQEERADKQRLVDIETQLLAQQQKIIELQNRGTIDPNAAKKKQWQELKEEYQHLQEQMYLSDKKFVHPSLMAKLLTDLLKQNDQLTLIKLETLPVKQVELLYQHGLILRFSGSYSATLAYLKAVEAMPWNFFWDSIDYQVKDYPLAEITLRIHTLSLDKSWLDV